ncbi:hypothetical protein NLG97_g7522 [Lecanicillium saksenae]|uniref:Uncharacterized protein n=1 Tax=Lecanicillium saksenae TaxID=468837 RepID=A0ACC1QLM1_9HYPO|nr:hypothetical protein NLG97_g7522 [Lecanicillium saksenae]
MAVFSERMERIRRDLIQRAHAERSDAMERGAAGHVQPLQIPATEGVTQSEQRRPLELSSMFLRPLDFLRRPITAGRDAHRPETPKSPRPAAPVIGRNETEQPGNVRAHNSESEVTVPSPAVVTETDAPVQPIASQPHSQDSHRSGRRGEVEKAPGSAKKRFLFCLPWIKSGRVRVALMHCITSGLFVLLLVAVYLGLSLSQHIETNELTILLLLIIVISTLFFCYNIVRLCIAVVRGDKSPTVPRGRQPMNPADILKTGYAMPRRPIRVVLAQDEEAAGREDVTNKLTPPAYGFWRESVNWAAANNEKRLDPNRLYWQRNEAARREEPVPESGPGHGHSTGGTARPPSYASDDGVSYVVEAMTASSTSTLASNREQRP